MIKSKSKSKSKLKCDGDNCLLYNNNYDFELFQILNKSLCGICVIKYLNPFETTKCVYLIENIYSSKSDSICSNSEYNYKFHIDDKIHPDETIYLYILNDSFISRMVNINHNSSSNNKNLISTIFLNSQKINNDLLNGIDITNRIKTNPNLNNTITINCSKIETLILIIIKRKNIAKLKDIKSNLQSLSKSKSNLINAMKSELITLEEFSINCVYSGNIIKTPVKSYNCKHFQCFDLITYLHICKFRKKFNCPICKQPAFIPDLYEDKYFKDVISEIKSEISKSENFNKKLFIDDNAKWKFI